ncbi:MAG: tRNA (cytidine(34)-2'-O)-methyltransferase [Pseudomonadota bacterium]
MRLALYQPEIPQNTGTILRMAACFGVEVDLIGPASFDLSDRALRRAALDYLPQAVVTRHVSFAAFAQQHAQTEAGSRLVLATTKADVAHTAFHFRKDDVVLFGRESAGVPDSVHAQADARIAVPLQPDMRSLNIAVCAAIIVGEALRQLNAYPPMLPAPSDPAHEA